MKVLHVGKFFSPVVGGMESVLFDLVKGLNNQGIATDVICAHTTNTSSVERTRGGYSVTRVASFGMVASTSICPGMVPMLRKIANRYDLIHIHLPNPMANLAMLFGGFKGKVVLHWHSDIVKQRHLLKLYEPLQSWILDRADAIVATSPAYAESSPYLATWRSKVSIIPIGIDPSSLPVDEQRLAELREAHMGRKIVFALGRMTYYKGFQYLIDAARNLPKDIRILIGGSGELKEQFALQIRSSGLEDRIQLLGKVPASDLGAYYALCDIFCLPSIARSEAFGVVMLEAMSLGKPVIATDIPGSGVPWVNQHGLSGLNIPVKDSDSLARTIANLAEDSNLQTKLGAGARRHFEANFGAAKMTGQLIDLYRQI